MPLRGQYRGNDPDTEEWCDRRLLARIHHDTIRTLRRQIEPVSPAVFMQFLFHWHDMGDERGSGPHALRRAIGRLQGFPIPAAAWEAAVLPHRVENYSRTCLDELLGSGQFLWLRPRFDPGRNQIKAGPVRSTLVMLVDRSEVDHWLPILAPGDTGALSLSVHAQTVCSALGKHGASFFVDLVRGTGLLRTQVETALAELVAWGLVTSDTFAGLRVLITPSSKRASFSKPRRGRSGRRRSTSVDAAGRWVLVEQGLHLDRVSESERSEYSDASVKHVALALLDRYGVVFRGLLHRESRLLPPWRRLARVYRRLEARGEIRGGRFVNGFSGEHFAWPEAVDSLRSVQRKNEGRHEFIVSAADPLNLAGIITPGARVPVAVRNRLLYRDGVPVAVYVAGEFEWLESPDAAREWSARNLLIRNDPGLTYIPGSNRLS